MDEQLKELKKPFENSIPTSFSETDKQAIRSKINSLKQKPARRRFSYYPTVITGAVLAFAILIFAITMYNQPNRFADFSNDEAAESGEEASIEMRMESFDSGAAESSDTENSVTITEDSVTRTIFNPKDAQNNALAKDVQQNGDTSIITFDGSPLTGSFVTTDTALQFIPNPESLLQIPVATGDVEKEIPIYVANEEFVQANYDVESASEITLDVTDVTYHYSPEGSKIYLKIREEQ